MVIHVALKVLALGIEDRYDALFVKISPQPNDCKSVYIIGICLI